MKLRTIKIVFLTLTLLALAATETFSQCAMCRATLENNVSAGKVGIAAGINFGILYLFVAPYLAISVLAYLWYRTSRKNASKIDSRSVAGMSTRQPGLPTGQAG